MCIALLKLSQNFVTFPLNLGIINLGSFGLTTDFRLMVPVDGNAGGELRALSGGSETVLFGSYPLVSSLSKVDTYLSHLLIIVSTLLFASLASTISPSISLVGHTYKVSLSSPSNTLTFSSIEVRKLRIQRYMESSLLSPLNSPFNSWMCLVATSLCLLLCAFNLSSSDIMYRYWITAHYEVFCL